MAIGQVANIVRKLWRAGKTADDIRYAYDMYKASGGKVKYPFRALSNLGAENVARALDDYAIGGKAGVYKANSKTHRWL